jgi:hypothetical protein
MKNFEFESVGKDIPYEVKDNFFSESSMKILRRMSDYDKKRKQRKRLRLISYAAAILALGVLIGVNFYFQKSKHQIDYVLKHMSDNDVHELEHTVTSDPFY